MMKCKQCNKKLKKLTGFELSLIRHAIEDIETLEKYIKDKKYIDVFKNIESDESLKKFNVDIFDFDEYEPVFDFNFGILSGSIHGRNQGRAELCAYFDVWHDGQPWFAGEKEFLNKMYELGYALHTGHDVEEIKC